LWEGHGELSVSVVGFQLSVVSGGGQASLDEIESEEPH
jgi:hypothetical protein